MARAFVPAVTCIVGAVALGEQPTVPELLGMAGVVAGIALALRPERAQTADGKATCHFA